MYFQTFVNLIFKLIILFYEEIAITIEKKSNVLKEIFGALTRLKEVDIKELRNAMFN